VVVVPDFFNAMKQDPNLYPLQSASVRLVSRVALARVGACRPESRDSSPGPRVRSSPPPNPTAGRKRNPRWQQSAGSTDRTSGTVTSAPNYGGRPCGISPSARTFMGSALLVFEHQLNTGEDFGIEKLWSQKLKGVLRDGMV